MGKTYKLTEYIPVPTGDYVATIERVEETTTEFGDQLKFTFRLDGQYNDRTLWAWCSARFSTKSKFYAWVSSIFGKPPPSGFVLDLDSLLNRKVILVVIQTSGENGPLNRITALKTYKQPAPGAVGEIDQEYPF